MSEITQEYAVSTSWRDYLEMCKPRVVMADHYLFPVNYLVLS